VIDLGLLERVRYVEEGVDSFVSERLRTKYYAFLNIFTDGSKDPITGRTEAAFCLRRKEQR
jgi:hypothetical protein